MHGNKNIFVKSRAYALQNNWILSVIKWHGYYLTKTSRVRFCGRHEVSLSRSGGEGEDWEKWFLPNALCVCYGRSETATGARDTSCCAKIRDDMRRDFFFARHVRHRRDGFIPVPAWRTRVCQSVDTMCRDCNTITNTAFSDRQRGAFRVEFPTVLYRDQIFIVTSF